MKHLYKSDKNRVVSGIFGGLGEYYDIDPTILRLAWLLVLVLTVVIPGVIVYIIAAFIVPSRVKKV